MSDPSCVTELKTAPSHRSPALSIPPSGWRLARKYDSEFGPIRIHFGQASNGRYYLRVSVDGDVGEPCGECWVGYPCQRSALAAAEAM